MSGNSVSQQLRRYNVVRDPKKNSYQETIVAVQQRIKGTEKASPYTPYSIGNSSQTIYKTIDP